MGGGPVRRSARLVAAAGARRRCARGVRGARRRRAPLPPLPRRLLRARRPARARRASGAHRRGLRAAGRALPAPAARRARLPGETAGSMVSGGRCRYAGGSQLRAAERFLRRRGSRVALVTVSIGGNDVLRCGSPTGRGRALRSGARARGRAPGRRDRAAAARGGAAGAPGRPDLPQPVPRPLPAGRRRSARGALLGGARRRLQRRAADRVPRPRRRAWPAWTSPSPRRTS